MNKQFFYALLCGAMILFTGTFTSCNNDDELNDLKGRVSVLEVALEDIVQKALTTGASVTSAQKGNDGSWKISLSDGQVIDIAAPGTGGGGSNITVTITDTEAIFTIDEREYRLPLGASVSSLVYSPEYVDGIVELGNEGAEVRFLARPALTSVDGATFTVAESHGLKTRATDGEDFSVTSASIDGNFIKLTIVGIGAAASSTHAVSVQMELKGTVIGSNYFTVQVSDDFEFKAEDIDPAIQPKAAYSTGATLADGFVEMQVNGVDFSAVTNFKDLFDGLPTDAQFVIAPEAVQPGGDAQAKQGVLASSLATDGTWTLTERLGTSFNGNAERKGFLVYVRNADLQIKAKIWVMINDELANLDFITGSDNVTLAGGGLVQLEKHMEYGTPAEVGLGLADGTPIIVEPGVNSINLMVSLMAGKISIFHDWAKEPNGDGKGQGEQFYDSFKNYSLQVNGQDFIFSDQSTWVLSDFAKTFTKHSSGLKWVNIHSSLGKSQRRNWVDAEGNPMADADKQAIAGSDCNGELQGGWDPTSAEDLAAHGIRIAENGFLQTDALYGGWCMRLGVGLRFEYDYGEKNLHNGCLVFLWINRRNSAEGVVDLAPR